MGDQVSKRYAQYGDSVIKDGDEKWLDEMTGLEIRGDGRRFDIDCHGRRGDKLKCELFLH